MSSCATTFHQVSNGSHMASWAESPSQGLQDPPIDGSTSPVRLLAASERGHSASAIRDKPITRSQRNHTEPLSPQWLQSVHQPSSLRYQERDNIDPRTSGGRDQGQTFFPPERETKDENQYYRRNPKQKSRDPEKAGSVYSEDQDCYPQNRFHAHHTIDRHERDGVNNGAEEHSAWILVRAC